MKKFRPFLLRNLSSLVIALLLLGCQDKKDNEQIEASFNPNPAITGYTLPLANSTIKSDTITFYVSPKALANTVVLSVAGQNRVTIHDIKRNAAEGTIKFTLKGTSATPTSAPKGDTFVLAKNGEKELARDTAIVVIPKAIAKPHPEFDGAVTGFNQAGDASTSPAWWGQLPNGSVKLLTWYVTFLTIPVNDQFGKRLDKIYKGTAVTEHNNQPINQQMTAAGTYQDPVGSYRIPGGNSEVPKTIPDPQNPSQQIPNPVVTNFVNGQALPIYVFSQTQNIRVQVGGHELDPAVVNRKMEATAPNKIKITWP